MIFAITALVAGQVSDIVPQARASRLTWISGILTRSHSAVAVVLAKRKRLPIHLIVDDDQFAPHTQVASPIDPPGRLAARVERLQLVRDVTEEMITTRDCQYESL
jgi:hypothetical protein